MLTYDCDSARKEGKILYLHVYDCIRNDILDGTLAAGERLPSKRALASHLGVSVITVENAYAKLADEGYIHTEEKRGFFVSNISVDERLKGNRIELLFSDGASVVSEPDDSAEPGVIQLSANYTPPELFPLATWSRLVRRVLTERAGAIMQPSPANGVLELRNAIARHLYEFRGLSVRPEQIVVGAGTEYLYSLIIQLLGFDNVFAVEDPGYPKISAVYDVCAVRSVPVALDPQGISMEGLTASGANIAHVSPSHHFPTGRTTTISRRYELLGWAASAENRFIIEDDYDAEFRLNGRIIPPLLSIDTVDRVIYLNTFTKTLSPTLRTSYMVLPQSLLERFRKKLGFYANTVAVMHQHTLALFISEGHFESHINRLRRISREQKERAVSMVRSYAALRDSTVLEADAGLYFLLRIATAKSDTELRAAALREGLSLSFLSDYYVRTQDAQEAAHTIIVSYAALSSGTLTEAIARLARAVSS